jgi:hypothetical protein
MTDKIGILLFEQFHGKENIGSSRIRGHWLAKYWPEAEISKHGGTYDVMIYQKVYWLEHARMFQGIKILDLCDPDWYHWGHRVKQMIDLCDAVTTSTLELAKFIVQITDKPVWYIPDRLDPEMFNFPQKEHIGEAKKAVWYGYSENFPMLIPALPSLIKYGYDELIVIASNRSPFKIPKQQEGKIQLLNLPWTKDTANADIQKGDIVINPKSNKGKWKYKSNNKTINAWALGMPVAHNDSELEKFKSAEARQKEAKEKFQLVKDKFDVRQSVEEYKNLINEIRKTKI